MRRFFFSCATLAAISCVVASPAWADASGNFYLKGGGELACHWASFGGVDPHWATSGFIRCERYSDHTFVEMTRKGRIIVKHHYRGWIAPGGRIRPPHLISVSHRTSCFTLKTTSHTFYLSCAFFPANGGAAIKSFAIGPTGSVGIAHH